MVECVAIVGVGLIGASLGLAIKRRNVAGRVVGFGRRVESLEAAVRVGAVDDFSVGLDEMLSEADLAVLCVPVDRIAELGEQAGRLMRPNALLTDAGSTKEIVVSELERRLAGGGPAYVGSHPLAGSEHRGPEAADPMLFESKVCVVTPTALTDKQALERVTAFWQALGMMVVATDPQEHDRVLARTSHLPHLAATALACLLRESDRPLAASGFRDTTRVAAGDPSLWRAVFDHNRAAVLDSLDEYLALLTRMRTALVNEDFDTLEGMLADGKRGRDALGS